MDLLDDDTDLDREQESLDKHEDEVAQLAVRLERFVIACSSTDINLLKIATKRFRHLEKRITSVFDSISSLPPDDDNVCLLQQHEESMTELKKELSDVRSSVMSFDLEDTMQ